MRFHLQCIYLLLLLIVIATNAVLRNVSPQKHSRSKRAVVETSKCKKKIENDGMDLINYGIEALTVGKERPTGLFLDSLKFVFTILQNKKNETKWRIADALKPKYSHGYQSLLRKAKDPNDLESTLVFMYTDDDIYGDLNYALSQHKCTAKTLDQKDKAFAPYAAALLATLLYWGGVQGYDGVTYRMIGNVRGDIKSALKLYGKGNSVVFPAFSSSSNLIDAAFNFIEDSSDKNILLIIDNSTPSLWRPKDIQRYSKYRNEGEFLYPSVAKFRVLDKPVKKAYNQGTSYYEIRLQLDGQKLKENFLQKVRRVCRMN